MANREILSRRQFLRRGVETAAAVTVVAITLPEVKITEAQEPHWADKFIWVAPEGGLPEAPSTPDGLGELGVILGPNQSGIGVFSQFEYDKPDPMKLNRENLFVPGREGHPVVCLIKGKKDEETRLTLRKMPVKGGWFGVFVNPRNEPLSDTEAWEAVRVRIGKLRDPRLNNCKPGVGCQGPVEYVTIDTDESVSDHGYRNK